MEPRIDFRDELLVLSVFSFLFCQGPTLINLIQEFPLQGCKEVICNFIFIRFFVYFQLELVQTFDVTVIETIMFALAFERWTKPRLSNDQSRLLTLRRNLWFCL